MVLLTTVIAWGSIISHNIPGCYTDIIQQDQLVKIYIHWADTHPNLLHLAKGQAMVLALIDAFPCPKKRGWQDEPIAPPPDELVPTQGR